MSVDRTGIVIPPPLLFAAPFVVGWFLERRSPWPLVGQRAWSVGVGVAGVCLGAAIAIAGVREFRRARTTVLPFGGTLRIVSSGVYRWTRNPMYVGMALSYLGFSVITNSVWCLLLLPAAILLVQVLAIQREERYLADKFGQSYERYRANTRRWI